MFKFKVQRCRDSEDGLGLAGAGVLLCNGSKCKVATRKVAKCKVQVQNRKVQGIGRNVTPPTNTDANAGMRTGRSTATILIRRKCFSLALSDVVVELLCNRGQRISCKVTPVENTLKQVEAGIFKNFMQCRV